MDFGCPHIEGWETSVVIADDSVQNKKYSNFIELVKRQCSGNEHGTVKGIGLVNLVHSSGNDGDFWPIDYRVYSPEDDGKTKNDHFQEMFTRLATHKRLKARTILFDTWYAPVANLKLIHRGAGRPLRSKPNRSRQRSIRSGKACSPTNWCNN